MERTDELKERIRQQPLNDRLEESRRRIGDMCSQGRCPKMTIPVQHDDDDFYINTTLADAQATIAALQARVKELEEWVQDQSTANLETMRHVDEMQSRAMDAESQLTQRTAELEAAKRDRDELQSVFDLGHTRTVEADKLWQDAHGKPEVWPDLGDLVGWLIKRHDDVQAELERVRDQRGRA